MSSRIILIFFILIFIGVAGLFILYDYNEGVDIALNKKMFSKKDDVKIYIHNKFNDKICFSNCYPYYIEQKNGEWEKYSYPTCKKEDIAVNCIRPGSNKTFLLENPSLSAKIYRLEIPICIGCEEGEKFVEDKKFYSKDFKLKKN